MKEATNSTTNYLSPGSICWAVFLEMGARLENSPNGADCHLSKNSFKLTLLIFHCIIMKHNIVFLRECFHKDVHERLSALIISWYPCLKNVDTETNPLEITDFEFDKDKTTSLRIYMDLIELIENRALIVPVTVLAKYLAEHSNLSRSYATLYQQISDLRRSSRRPLIK
jgi:hypothetical protein